MKDIHLDVSPFCCFSYTSLCGYGCCLTGKYIRLSSGICQYFSAFTFPSTGLLLRSIPEHKALHGGDAMFEVMCCGCRLPNTASSLMAEKLHFFCLIRPNNLLPIDLGVAHMPLLATLPSSFDWWRTLASVVCTFCPIWATETLHAFTVDSDQFSKK